MGGEFLKQADRIEKYVLWVRKDAEKLTREMDVQYEDHSFLHGAYLPTSKTIKFKANQEEYEDE